MNKGLRLMREIFTFVPRFSYCKMRKFLKIFINYFIGSLKLYYGNIDSVMFFISRKLYFQISNDDFVMIFYYFLFVNVFLTVFRIKTKIYIYHTLLYTIRENVTESNLIKINKNIISLSNF